MVTKYVATDRAVGNDANSGDDPSHPWLSFQRIIDRLVALRTNPTETNVLYILNFQVDEPAVLKGPRYSKFEFIGVTVPNVTNDPHQDVLFCEPRVRLTSLDPTKPIFTVEQADDILFKDLQLFDSVGGGGIVAREAKRIHVVTCCIHDNKAKRGAGFLFEKCSEPLVAKCRVEHNEATATHGGGGAFKTCKDAKVVGSVFYTNVAARSGGALSFEDCTGDISIEENIFGDVQVHGNKAQMGGAVSAEKCAKITFGSPRGFNTFKWNEATDEGGAVYLDLCKEVAVVRDVYFENRTIQRGGAICSRGTDLTLAEVKVGFNHAGRGGGIYASGTDRLLNVIGGKLTMESSELRRNDAVAAGGGAAAFWIDVKIARCAFLDINKASSGGGLDFEDSPINPGKKLEIQSGTFQENQSHHGGGGCAISGGQVSIRGTTLEDNNGYAGGGLRYIGGSQSTLALEACHFTDNESSNGGGGVELRFAKAGHIRNNKISGNRAPLAAGLFLVDSDVRALDVSGNDFNGNKTTDIFVGLDQSTPRMTAAELQQNNPGSPVPVVKIF